MTDESKTLREILSDPLIAKIAPDAIRNMDLSKEPMWEKSLFQLREEHFGGNLAAGFEALFRQARTGDWYYPLYSQAECLEDPNRSGANLVWLPSDADGASSRPFLLLVPGGGFVNVWNLTEGWPIAARFNRLGYNVFILTYQVSGGNRLLDREMGDFARALRLIRDRAEHFAVDPSRYLTCGFSAGGYLVCLWNVREKGYAFHGLPKPKACFPVYPLTSWKQYIEDRQKSGDSSWENEYADGAFFGCDLRTAAESPFEIPDHAEGFPPCAFFLTETDGLVNPEHSRRLARALTRLGIPCRMEIGASGGHGFADGSDMCMDGWIERAIQWYESL